MSFPLKMSMSAKIDRLMQEREREKRRIASDVQHETIAIIHSIHGVYAMMHV